MKTYHNPNKGAVKLATDFTEYASNNSATTTDDLVSFYNGVDGSLVQAFAPSGLTAVVKYVQFNNPIQQTDILIFEFCAFNNIWRSTTNFAMAFHYDSPTPTYSIGCNIELVPGNARQLRACFYSKPNENMTWSTIASSYRWRIRKVSGGNLAEQPEVNPSITVTGNYSIIPNIKTVNVNASTATIDLTNMIVTDSITIRKLSAYDGNALVITSPSGATFEGRASISLYGQYSYVEIERISATVFAIRDLKDEYVWDSGTGAKVIRRWGQLSEKQFIGTLPATAATPVDLGLHWIEPVNIREISGVVNFVIGDYYLPLNYISASSNDTYRVGAYTANGHVYCEMAAGSLSSGVFSRPVCVTIKYQE